MSRSSSRSLVVSRAVTLRSLSAYQVSACPATTCVVICALACLAVGCSPPPDPEPDMGTDMPEPTAEYCAQFQRQEACYRAGCSIFTSANIVEGDEQSCSLGASESVCLLTRDTNSDAALLTYYMETGEDGVRRVVRLDRDVEVAGWQRCGYTEVPPDCDCDGS